MKEPSGLRLRGQIWPLSIWVWQSTKAGSTMRPARSMARGGGAVAARGNAGDLAVGDRDVGEREAVGVEGGDKAGRQRAMHAGIGEHVLAGGGDWMMSWLPLIPLPGPSPRKNGEKSAVRNAGSYSEAMAISETKTAVKLLPVLDGEKVPAGG